MANLIRKTQYFLIFGLILIGLLVFTERVYGQDIEPLNLNRLNIKIEKNQVKIEWSTNFESSGKIVFGETTSFGSWIMDQENKRDHEIWLTGLKGETKYYFQIQAFDSFGRNYYSVVYDFKTNNNDGQGPVLSNIEATFVSGNSVLITWQTDEKSDSCINYGTVMSELKQRICGNSNATIHEVIIRNLKRDTFYYYRVSSQDKAKNKTESVYYNFRTLTIDDKDLPDLTIRQMEFQSAVDQQGKIVVTLKFQANRPVSGKFSYGESSKQYKWKVDLPAPRSAEPIISLTNLDYYKKYYYQLEVKDIFNKTIKTPEQLFFTPSRNYFIAANTNLDYQPTNPNQDFDADGLTNSQEKLYGTSPIKADSDGDGYLDGQEIQNGYNPLGSGRLTAIAGVKIYAFAYNQPRLASLRAEQNSAQELSQKLKALFKGPIPVAKSGWPTLVNAYIYGDYPVEAIYQAIIHSGKTVHPTIPWSAWKKSNDYKRYIK